MFALTESGGGDVVRIEFLAATALGTTLLFAVPGVAVAQPAYDWSGFYAGISVGGASTTSDITLTYTAPASGPAAADFGTVGALLALNVGYNIQVGNGVAGIEADAALTAVDGTVEEPGSYVFDERLESLLTLRSRFGVTSGPVYAYGTMGLAAGQADFSAVVDNGYGGSPVAATNSGLAVGIVGGAGVEVAVNDAVSLKTEGMMYRLAPLSASGDTGKGAFDSEYTPSGLVVRSGVNVQF